MYAIAADGSGVGVATIPATGQVALTRLDGGGAVVDTASVTATGIPGSLARRADGRWLLSVQASTPGTVIELDANLDASAPRSTPDVIMDIVVQPDGAVLLLGLRSLSRELAAGGVDTSFGTGGTVAATGFNESWSGMAVLADGRIAVVGRIERAGLFRPQAMVRVLTAAGAPDTSFGEGGVVQFPPRDYNSSFPPESVARDVAVAADGSLIVVGREDGLRPRWSYVSRVSAP